MSGTRPSVEQVAIDIGKEEATKKVNEKKDEAKQKIDDAKATLSTAKQYVSGEKSAGKELAHASVD